MNQPSATTLHIPHEQLRAFTFEALKRVDMPVDDAAMIARLLTETDLHGVFSHGTWRVGRYVHEIRSGGINPRPHMRVVHETANSVLIDGDGGLGFMPFYEATRKAIDKANAQGMAMAVTRHHGHIGAAGIYTRLAAAADLCAFATSGAQLRLKPDSEVHRAAGSSPMSFAAPAGAEPPLVLDCGVTFEGQARRHDPRDQIAELAPGLVLRIIGLGTVCQAWGGLLTGLPIDPQQPAARYRAANQGALLHVFDPCVFTDGGAFKHEMDEYARRVHQLEPVPGSEGAYLPGAIELERERVHRRDGVPVDERHQRTFEQVAEELGMRVPWA